MPNHSCPLVNNPGFSDWFTDRGPDRLAGFTRMHFLLKDNRTDFKGFFGPRHRSLRGEFFHHIWDLTFKEEPFMVFTAAGKGTSYEYAAPGTNYDTIRDPALTPLFIRFAEWLYAKFDPADIIRFRADLQSPRSRPTL